MSPEIITVVNAALDRMRDEQKLATEGELARACGVDESTLWRWRNGKSLSKSTRILIPLILVQSEQTVIEQAA